MSDKLTCRLRPGSVCRNLSQFGDRATPASGLGCERRRADLAPPPPPRHHPDMGRDPIHPGKSDLFSTGQETFPSAANPASSANVRRHDLPKDLPNAVKHLRDEELDRLLAATLAEAKRRGRQTASTYEPSLSRKMEAAVSLTRGQLNAVRAAFKAGITPARIARQFGLSQSDVRTALKSHTGE
jgi:hypothetical protein